MAPAPEITEPALAATLQLAHDGTAFFARALGGLSDAELRDPCLLEGWTRAHLVAHVAYNARALTRLTVWAGTGVETPMYASREARNAEIELGAVLPAGALRELSDEAIAELSAGWEKPSEAAWSHEVRTSQGHLVPLSETPWMRAREVWLHAIDLGTGASMDDLPAEFVDRLLPEIVALWQSRGDAVPALVLRATDRALELPLSDAAGLDTLAGPAAQLLAWAAGRPSEGLTLSGGGSIPAAPRWI